MKVLIIDSFHEALLEGFQSQKLQYDYFPKLDRMGVLALSNAYQGLIVRSKTKIDKELLDHFLHLEFIARGGAGMDGIDIDLCNERNIQLFNAPEGNRDAVAEQTIAMTLAWFTKLVWANNSVFNSEWNREMFRGSEIKNKTIGIIGFGNTGKEVAKRWQSFGCTILSNDIDSKQYDLSLAKPVSLPELLKTSDVVSVHIPLLKANHHFVNSHFISQLKTSSLLLNMSRGAILDTPNVLQLLAQGKFAGLCLDVLENEQKQDFPKLDIQSKSLLFELKDRIILSPHIGGWTHESYQKIATVLLQKITNYFEERTYEENSTKH